MALPRKRKEVKGKMLINSRWVWEQHFGKIPPGLYVHHIDGDTLHDDIDNLALVTATAHNRIHRHPAWNKGMKIAEDKKWAQTFKKAQQERRENYLPICQEAFKLQLDGKKLREIAEIQGISQRQVSDRIKKMLQYFIYVTSKLTNDHI